MPRTGFEFLLRTFPTDRLAAIRPFFANLPTDPYIQGKFRQRRFSHFSGPGRELRRLGHTPFEQSRTVNYLLGGVKREYQELEDGLVATDGFRDLIDFFIRELELDPRREIGVHQIRILCSPEFHGDPAPEGIHQDGFDYIGIFCVDRQDVRGANTHLYRDRKGEPIFSRTLAPGEGVLVDDRAVLHYTDPVYPTTAGIGHRDVFVLTT
jgi:hypothetical protein